VVLYKDFEMLFHDYHHYYLLAVHVEDIYVHEVKEQDDE
jgi:hypothetical protein